MNPSPSVLLFYYRCRWNISHYPTTQSMRQNWFRCICVWVLYAPGMPAHTSHTNQQKIHVLLNIINSQKIYSFPPSLLRKEIWQSGFLYFIWAIMTLLLYWMNYIFSTFKSASLENITCWTYICFRGGLGGWMGKMAGDHEGSEVSWKAWLAPWKTKLKGK